MQKKEMPIKSSLNYCSLILNCLRQRLTPHDDTASSRCVDFKYKISEAACSCLSHELQLVAGCSISLLVHQLIMPSSVFEPYAGECRIPQFCSPSSTCRCVLSFAQIVNNQTHLKLSSLTKPA